MHYSTQEADPREGLFSLSVCAKVSMYFGAEPVSAFKLPGDKHASKILREHPPLQALKHQLGLFACSFRVYSALIPRAFVQRIVLLCRGVKSRLSALPFSKGFS